MSRKLERNKMKNNYIVKKRFNQKALQGMVNLPYATLCTEINGLISNNDGPLCYNTSQNAYDYFAINNDNKGLLRGELIDKILKRLNKDRAFNPKKHQERWDLLWEDESLTKYRRAEHSDFWAWSKDFYEAPIEELERILTICQKI